MPMSFAICHLSLNTCNILPSLRFRANRTVQRGRDSQPGFNAPSSTAASQSCNSAIGAPFSSPQNLRNRADAKLRATGATIALKWPTG